MQIEISADKRVLQGKGASRRLRGCGKVPGIIYGGENPAQAIELDHNNLYHKLKLEAFHASILSIDLAGKKEQVLLRDLQMHPYKLQVLHIDFQRVDKNKEIHTKVPLHFINAEVSPGVKQSGGIVSHILTEIEISCLPKDLPEFIEVDLSEVDVNDVVHLSSLKLPVGVEMTGFKGNDDDDLTVATIVIPRAVVSEESATEEESVDAAEVPTTVQKQEEDEKDIENKDAGKKK
jgi:large subunit ribosomal protein L25